jgi:hypothetical protein
MGIAAISPTVRLIGKDQVEKSPNANHPAGGSHRQLSAEYSQQPHRRRSLKMTTWSRQSRRIEGAAD